MSTFTKSILAVVIAAVAAGGIYGGYKFLLSPRVPSLGTASPANTTNTSPKMASQVVPVSTSTLLSFYNGSGVDRTITRGEVFLIGTTTTTAISTTTAFTISCATSTVATGFTPANTNYIWNQTIASALDAFGSTTDNIGYYNASTSPGVTGTTTTTLYNTGQFLNKQDARIWANGSYLVCELSGTGGSVSNLLSSTTQGTVTFYYTGQ